MRYCYECQSDSKELMVNSKWTTCKKASKVLPIDNFWYCLPFLQVHTILKLDMFGIYLLEATSSLLFYHKMSIKMCMCVQELILVYFFLKICLINRCADVV